MSRLKIGWRKSCGDITRRALLARPQRRGAGPRLKRLLAEVGERRRRTPSGSGSVGSSRRRKTLTISTSWRLASSPAVVNVVRIVPPTPKALMMRSGCSAETPGRWGAHPSEAPLHSRPIRDAGGAVPAQVRAAAPGHGPIFIVSAMGSGSTLLRLILDSHDRIAIPQETGFMRAYNAHQFVPLKWSGRNWARRMGWSREELDEELARFYDAHLPSLRRDPRQAPLGRQDAAAHVARRRHGAAVPGRGVHRDRPPPGRQRRLEHEPLRPLVRPRRPRTSTSTTARSSGRRRATATGSPLVRYEELVLRPEPVLRELLDWLGEPWSRPRARAPPACRSAAAAGSRSRARTGSTTRSTSRGSTSGTGRCPRTSGRR